MLKMSAVSLKKAEENLKLRNREVLLSNGRDQLERYVEQEFQRVETLVNRDLAGYPSLQRDLREQITLINEDYVQSNEVPPQPPEWIKAVDTIAKIPSEGSPVVAKILNDIYNTLKKALDKNVFEYRKSSKNRHELLKKMLPYWRSLNTTLESVEEKISGLEGRSQAIDKHMQEYESILAKTDYAERTLSSSSLTQFFISGLVLCISFVGMYVNFQLVALPMSEMVGAGSYVGGVKASDVAALFIIAIEVILGLFLMEAVGVTRLFPVISALDDKKIKAIVVATFSFLLIFACIEASLAYMRDLLAADREALTQVLAGVTSEEPEFRWIPSVGQMVMGFILPFVLTFVAIPLETFIHSSRTVLGIFFVSTLRFLSIGFRLSANFILGIGKFLTSVYDLIIFLPLRIEAVIVPKDSDHSFQEVKSTRPKTAKGDK
ncbi:MAG: hypothetical protein KAT04_01760 [Methylococcales bacterium]|nr:hypothetical protein [Methylococcales bacterium]